MKITTAIVLFFLVFAGTACDRKRERVSADFVMPVDKIEVLNGVILRGIALSGTIENRCIATGDDISVTRDGEAVLEELARVINVEKQSDTEDIEGRAFQGDYATLYIPDGKKEDFRRGDVVISDAISCSK